MRTLDLAIEGGWVVRESGEFPANVGISDGRITTVSQEPLIAARVIDASGHLVVPGGVDTHVHVMAPGDPNMAPICETLPEASVAGILGGVTTLGAYARSVPGVSLKAAIAETIRVGEGDAWCDFLIDVIILPSEPIVDQVAQASELGVGHFKGMMAYANRGLMLSDGHLYELMCTVADRSGTVLIHAENGSITKELERRMQTKEELPLDAFLQSSPGYLEAEGLSRAIAIARMTDIERVIFVHMSSREAVREYRRTVPVGEQRRFMIETQPHYAMMTNESVLERGPLAKVGPPLKLAEDVTAIRRGLQNGVIHHLSSDHSPRMREVKLGTPSILDAPYGGINGTGLLYRLAFAIAGEEGLTSSDVVRLASTNPAKAYGLYPRKGEIQPGSDADIAVFKAPLLPSPVSLGNMTTTSDYAFYDGQPGVSAPVYVIRRGEVLVDNGELAVGAGPARYIPTS